MPKQQPLGVEDKEGWLEILQLVAYDAVFEIGVFIQEPLA